jgi:hypothetical protein
MLGTMDPGVAKIPPHNRDYQGPRKHQGPDGKFYEAT